MPKFSEVFQGYCMNKDGSYSNPVLIHSQSELSQFILKNVEQFYELRVVDKTDSCCMHVIDRTLVFPVPEHGSNANVWDSEKKVFCTVAKSS